MVLRQAPKNEILSRMKFATILVLLCCSAFMSGCAFTISPLMFLLIKNDAPQINSPSEDFNPEVSAKVPA